MTQEELNEKLLDAVCQNNIGKVKKTLSLGADVNSADNDNWTALMNAALRGYTDIAKLLLKHRTNVNAVDDYGNTALISACMWGYTNIVELLLEYGADINIKNNKGLTALGILKVNHPEKYKKWIEETVVKPRQEKLNQEDSVIRPEQQIDWNI